MKEKLKNFLKTVGFVVVCGVGQTCVAFIVACLGGLLLKLAGSYATFNWAWVLGCTIVCAVVAWACSAWGVYSASREEAELCIEDAEE